MTLHVDVPAAAEMSQLEFFTGVREGTGTFFATDTEPAIIQPVLRVHAQFCHRGHWLRQEFEWVERPEADPAASALVRATRIWGTTGPLTGSSVSGSTVVVEGRR